MYNVMQSVRKYQRRQNVEMGKKREKKNVIMGN
jgi:hypothetical protein